MKETSSSLGGSGKSTCSRFSHHTPSPRFPGPDSLRPKLWLLHQTPPLACTLRLLHSSVTFTGNPRCDLSEVCPPAAGNADPEGGFWLPFPCSRWTAGRPEPAILLPQCLWPVSKSRQPLRSNGHHTPVPF